MSINSPSKQALTITIKTFAYFMIFFESFRLYFNDIARYAL